MQYGIEWVKGLEDVQLCYVNLISFCKLYHYNLLYGYRNVKLSVRLSPAEAIGITKIDVLLRTRTEKKFTQTYYLTDREARTFRQMCIDDLQKTDGEDTG